MFRIGGTTTAARHPRVTLVTEENARTFDAIILIESEVPKWILRQSRCAPWVILRDEESVYEYVRQVFASESVHER